MLRRTSPVLGGDFVHMGFTHALVGFKHSNEHLLARSLYEKEQKKKQRQARSIAGGDYMNANKVDHRQAMFIQSAPMTSRLLIKKGAPRRQDQHWTMLENKYMVMRKNNELTHFETRMFGGVLFQQNWNSTVGYTDDLTLNMIRNNTNYEKNSAIRICEMWGLKTTVMDSEMNTGPRMTDVRKRHHPLYADNFPYLGMGSRWKSDRYHGDPDYIWKGNDKFDYSVYGAKTVSPYNYFRPSQFDAIRSTPFYNQGQAAIPAPASAPKAEEPKAAAKSKAEPKKEKKVKAEEPKAE